MSFGQECKALTRDRILAAIGRVASPDFSFPVISGNCNGV